MLGVAVLGVAGFGPPPAWSAAPPAPRAQVQATPVHPTPVPAPGFDGPVWATAASGGIVYVGGEFTHAIAAGRRHPRAGLAAVDARTGALLDWAPVPDGPVTAIATHAGDVFVAGRFSHVGRVPRDGLAGVDGVTGALRGGWRHVIAGTPLALGVGHGRLYLAGSISGVDQHQRGRLAAFDLATGAVDAGWAPAADAPVEAVAVTRDRVYLAGRFRTVNGVRGTQRVAAVHPVTGAVDGGFRAGDAVERAHGIAVGPDGIYVAHAGLGGRIRAYDQTGATRWELTMDGDPATVAWLGEVVYFGGHFDRVCRTPRVGTQGTCLDGWLPRGKLAAASGQDGTLLPWRADGDGVVGVRVVTAGPDRAELAVGGEFTTINGAGHRRFALFRAPPGA